jgi:pyruvate dehydrogenase (quinone)
MEPERRILRWFLTARPDREKVKHMAKKVAEIFVETLVNAGVKRVYGVVGDSLNGLTEVIRKSKQIDWVHVRHEEATAFAAGAEAHLTGDIAV